MKMSKKLQPENEKLIINGREIELMPEVAIDNTWVGNGRVEKQLAAAWLTVHSDDRPMNPLIVGRPGSGKTTLVAAMAKIIKRPLYIFQCTMDTRPEDLVITPVLTENRTVKYQASSLVSAMVKGGVCILDEGNRMRDKAWASLAPLLDARRYVESVVVGCRIEANPEFRLAATMNEDASVFNLPEYIRSRLRPRLEVPEPDDATLRQIIKSNLSFIDDKVLEAVMAFLRVADTREQAFSLRQAVQLAGLTSKICASDKNIKIAGAVEEGARLIADVTDIRMPEGY